MTIVYMVKQSDGNDNFNCLLATTNFHRIVIILGAKNKKFQAGDVNQLKRRERERFLRKLVQREWPE